MGSGKGDHSGRMLGHWDIALKESLGPQDIFAFVFGTQAAEGRQNSVV